MVLHIKHMAGPQHLPEKPWEGARLFPRKCWVGVCYPLALPGCLSNSSGCTLSISETSAPAHSQLSHLPFKFFSLYKSCLSCAHLPLPRLVLLAAGLPCSDSPCLQSPCEGRTLRVPWLPLVLVSSAGTEQLSGLRGHTQL